MSFGELQYEPGYVLKRTYFEPIWSQNDMLVQEAEGIKKKDTESKVIRRINKEVDNFHNSIVRFVGEDKKALIKASIFTVLFWSTGFMIPSMVLLGLGLEPYFIQS